MHIFVNALAASAGGGVTYVRNVVPHLSESGAKATFLLSPELVERLGQWKNVSYIANSQASGVFQRFRYEQTAVPELIRARGADILLSTGNFALRRSPVPQILLSRNALYTSADFSIDLFKRREYRTWIDTRIRGVVAKRSVAWADVTVAPSEAFAEELRTWTGKNVLSIYHGFDSQAFFGSKVLPLEIASRSTVPEGTIKLLFVSHYNYYRNFETLLRAIPVLKERLPGRFIRLFLTCRLQSDQNPGDYRAEGAAALIQELGIRNEIIELGTVPYESLHHIYKTCDLYVTPAYAETFAHPLVEAMSCGLPIIASDLPVHREICGDAALYFSRFSPADLAERAVELLSAGERRRKMSIAGRERSRCFSWSGHVAKLLSLAESLMQNRPV